LQPTIRSWTCSGRYGDAQLYGLKRAIGAIAVIALLALWFTRGLPGRSALRSSHADIVRAGAP
jgi:hypothetical protein